MMFKKILFFIFISIILSSCLSNWSDSSKEEEQKIRADADTLYFSVGSVQSSSFQIINKCANSAKISKIVISDSFTTNLKEGESVVSGGEVKVVITYDGTQFTQGEIVITVGGIDLKVIFKIVADNLSKFRTDLNILCFISSGTQQNSSFQIINDYDLPITISSVTIPSNLSNLTNFTVNNLKADDIIPKNSQKKVEVIYKGFKFTDDYIIIKTKEEGFELKVKFAGVSQ